MGFPLFSRASEQSRPPLQWTMSRALETKHHSSIVPTTVKMTVVPMREQESSVRIVVKFSGSSWSVALGWFFGLIVRNYEVPMVTQGGAGMTFGRSGTGPGMDHFYPEIREREWNEETHSKNWGTEREWEKTFPKFRNGKGMKKSFVAHPCN